MRIPRTMSLDSLHQHLHAIETALKTNNDYQASVQNTALKFGLKTQDDSGHITIEIRDGNTSLSTDLNKDVSFMLTATSTQWQAYFEPIPKPPFQSFWGMLRTIGPSAGVSVLGDTLAFARQARIWRLLLDQIRTTVNNTQATEADEVESDPEDFITGRYIHIKTPLHGRARIFVESSGSGPQQVLFLHTAGSDSRQSHAIMNIPSLQETYQMHAFDLPGHGRSDLGTSQTIGNLSLNEESYVSAIRQVIQKLGLKRVIVCGASMAGQVCLAVALRAKELDVAGTIACEACDHIPASPRIYDYVGADESVLNSETVCGMMSPTSSQRFQKQVWWGYSSQGIGIFKGDLKFYFQGWDGRGRMSGIECPVYMLTGQYDYSCTPEMSRNTFEEIRKAGKGDMIAFEEMQGMGHFPISEDPEKFLEYFLKALDFIKSRSS